MEILSYMTSEEMLTKKKGRRDHLEPSHKHSQPLLHASHELNKQLHSGAL